MLYFTQHNFQNNLHSFSTFHPASSKIMQHINYYSICTKLILVISMVFLVHSRTFSWNSEIYFLSWQSWYVGYSLGLQQKKKTCWSHRTLFPVVTCRFTRLLRKSEFHLAWFLSFIFGVLRQWCSLHRQKEDSLMVYTRARVGGWLEATWLLP